MDVRECFIDGSFASAKKGEGVGKGKSTKIMAIVDSHGLPIAVYTTSASLSECKLVKLTLDQRFVIAKPQLLIGDKAYHSDPLDQCLHQISVELTVPHKRNRVKAKT